MSFVNVSIFFVIRNLQITFDLIAVLYNDIYLYDVQNGAWSWPNLQGQAPSPRENMSVATDGNLLYVFGGWDGAGAIAFLQD